MSFRKRLDCLEPSFLCSKVVKRKTLRKIRKTLNVQLFFSVKHHHCICLILGSHDWSLNCIFFSVLDIYWIKYWSALHIILGHNCYKLLCHCWSDPVGSVSVFWYIGGSKGGVPGARPLLRVQTLSFQHTKFSKGDCLGSPRPLLRGPRPHYRKSWISHCGIVDTIFGHQETDCWYLSYPVGYVSLFWYRWYHFGHQEIDTRLENVLSCGSTSLSGNQMSTFYPKWQQKCWSQKQIFTIGNMYLPEITVNFMTILQLEII